MVDKIKKINCHFYNEKVLITYDYIFQDEMERIRRIEEARYY